MLNRSWLRLLTAIALLWSGTIGPVAANTVSLRWDAVADPEISGYRIYYGTSAQDLSANIDAGLVTATNLSLASCTTYFLAAKAYRPDGSESPEFSNMVSGWGRPVVNSVNPSALEQGSTVGVTVTGTNFQQGATVDLGSGLSINSTSVNGCGQIVLNVTVDAAANLGSRLITVINPDQVYITVGGMVSVGQDAAAPSIDSLVADAGVTSADVSWSTDESADGQVFFRLEGESIYRSTELDSTHGLDHDFTLHGLMPEATYQYYVASSDAGGNQAVSPTGSFATGASQFSYIRIEAEAGSLEAPIESYTAPEVDVFSGEWISLPAGTPDGTASAPAGEATYGFHVPDAGTWYVWLRMFGVSADGDAWLERVDGASYDFVQVGETGSWQWSAGRSYTLGQGLHTLQLGGLEADAGIDRILVTDDPDFIPTEQPGDDTTAPTGASAFSASGYDGGNALSWSHPSDPDATRLIVRYRTDGAYPATPADGLPLVDTVVSGAGGSFDHTALTNGTSYSYSVFTVDGAGNASEPATAQATPAAAPPDPVENLRRADTL